MLNTINVASKSFWSFLGSQLYLFFILLVIGHIFAKLFMLTPFPHA